MGKIDMKKIDHLSVMSMRFVRISRRFDMT